MFIVSLPLSLSPLSPRCWMKDNANAWLAHYMTNVGFLIILVSTGLVMLFVILGKIRKRDEWRKWKMAFLSIWGLSCLYGTTWVLGLFDAYCPVTFLFAIINTLQGKGTQTLQGQSCTNQLLEHAQKRPLESLH